MPDFDPNERQLKDAAYWAARLERRSQTGKSEADDVELARWFDADPSNADVLGEVAHTWEVVDSLADHPEMEALRRAALARVSVPMPRRYGWVPRDWKAIAASIALFVSVVGFPLWFTVPTTYATTIGERRVVTLSDGSRLSLDADTKVTLSYDKGRRMLWLERGRAKFKVAADPLRPFTVTAGDKIVVATGTEFSVERLKDQVLVVLYEGRVSLLEKSDKCTCDVPIQPGSKAHAADYLSRAHEMTLADGPEAGNQRISVGEIDPDRAASWESGMLSFKDERLDQVLDRFNRYATKPMVAGNTNAARLRVSGTFDANDANGLIEGLQAMFAVRVSEDDASVKFDLPGATRVARPAEAGAR
ncbi:MAG: FecR domain-containing protein [Sphingomonas sp.]